MPKIYPVSIQSVTTDIQRLIDQARKEGYNHGYANCRAEVATRIATGFDIVRKPVKKDKHK